MNNCFINGLISPYLKKEKSDFKKKDVWLSMLKVTVAIPIYNAAKHIKVTLDSLASQTMDASEFEILCVDDCSTDNSKEVIKEVQHSMSNLILMERIENSGGPMIPRNDAINVAKGEFILFLDNDDFLGEETLERFYNAATSNQSDVIYGKYIGVNGRKVPQSMFKKGNRLNADILEDNLVFSLAPHKMFRLSFLRENGFEFHPKAVVGEDQLFVMQCYIKANVITVLSDYEYYFVVSRGNENLSLKYFPANEFYFSFNRIMEFTENSDLNPIYKKAVKVAFLNRFFKTSRLLKYLLTDVLTWEQKLDWLNETKRFIDTHFDDETMRRISNEFKYFVQVCQENNLEKLLYVEKEIKKVSATQVTRVENGFIYGRLQQISKSFSINDEFIVNSFNKTEVFLNEMTFNKASFRITGQFKQSLLINFNVAYNLVLVHRKTGVERIHASVPAVFPDLFEFVVDYREILFDSSLTGPWDLYVEASVNDYKNRRRIGAGRSGFIKDKHRILPMLLSYGEAYSIQPYYTDPHDNISLDVKKG
jgi:poly(ribitol-phosphate) beta-glucosyltransferase